MARRRWNEQGLGLLEAIIALAAGLVVLSATIQSLQHFERRLWGQLDAMARHQDLRIGLNVMENELRLAGTGSFRGRTGVASVMLKAGTQDVTFAANLDGLTAALTEPAAPGQTVLTVNDGSDWRKGKAILLCDGARCVTNRLARDGRSKSLSLTEPLTQAFPSGSAVVVSNQVRYYLGLDSRGKTTLMRQVDGGANPLVSDVADFRLQYLDKGGLPTQDPVRVIRVRMELAVGAEGGRAWVSEVALRST